MGAERFRTAADGAPLVGEAPPPPAVERVRREVSAAIIAGRPHAEDRVDCHRGGSLVQCQDEPVHPHDDHRVQAVEDGAAWPGHVVIGGLTSDAPWADKMALTRPYAAVPTAAGQMQNMVMGVRLGENALMVALERYLAQEHGELR